MPKQYYPGTTAEKGDLSGKQFLNGVFLATNGLVMSQLNDLTGLKTPTLQNWVARGFLSRPQNKKYDKDQTARILIMNAVRTVAPLDEIKKTLFYLNGRAGDKTDDIIPESELYAYFCDVVFDDKFSYKTVEILAIEKTKNFNEKFSGAKTRLEKVLAVFCYFYLSDKLLSRADEILNSFTAKNIFGEELSENSGENSGENSSDENEN